jgi:hypothetical protein
MKLSLLTAAALLLCACSSSGGSSPDDFAQPSDENDITKAVSFTCTAGSDSGDFFDNAAVGGTGNGATITVKNDQGTYTGKIDPTYPNAKTSAANKDYRRFRWEKDDPWQDSGSSIMLVHKDMLEGKAGSMKFQVTGEVFENNFMKCTPKK